MKRILSIAMAIFSVTTLQLPASSKPTRERINAVIIHATYCATEVYIGGAADNFLSPEVCKDQAEVLHQFFKRYPNYLIRENGATQLTPEGIAAYVALIVRTLQQ